MSGFTYSELANVQGLCVDLPRRVLFVYGELDAEKAAQVQTAIYALECDGDGEVVVRLNSCGGNVSAGMAIYDALATADFTSLSVVVCGEAMSMAVPILQAGNHRRMTPNSRLFFHRASFALEEELDEAGLEKRLKDMQAMERQYEAIVAVRSGVSRKTIQKWTRNETYFLAEEAVKLGLADEVVKCKR